MQFRFPIFDLAEYGTVLHCGTALPDFRQHLPELLLFFPLQKPLQPAFAVLQLLSQDFRDQFPQSYLSRFFPARKKILIPVNNFPVRMKNHHLLLKLNQRLHRKPAVIQTQAVTVRFLQTLSLLQLLLSAVYVRPFKNSIKHIDWFIKHKISGLI